MEMMDYIYGANGIMNSLSSSEYISGIGSSYFIFNDLIDNTEYHWQVTAEDQSGATYTTPLQSFVVNSENDLPSDFDLLSPGNTTMVTDLTPEFHWDESTDPDLLGSIQSYSVFISTDDSFADVTPIEVNTNTYTATSDLLEDVLYYWKVVAKDDDGGEKASECWSFWTNSINSAPNEFTLTAPEQNTQTGLMPTFNWTASSDADLYDEIAYTLSYGTSLSNLQDITASSENAVNNFSLNFDGTDDYVEIENQSLETSVFGENISFSAKVLINGGENFERNILTNASSCLGTDMYWP